MPDWTRLGAVLQLDLDQKHLLRDIVGMWLEGQRQAMQDVIDDPTIEDEDELLKRVTSMQRQTEMTEELFEILCR